MELIRYYLRWNNVLKKYRCGLKLQKFHRKCIDVQMLTKKKHTPREKMFGKKELKNKSVVLTTFKSSSPAAQLFVDSRGQPGRRLSMRNKLIVGIFWQTDWCCKSSFYFLYSFFGKLKVRNCTLTRYSEPDVASVHLHLHNNWNYARCSESEAQTLVWTSSLILISHKSNTNVLVIIQSTLHLGSKK